MLIGVVSRDLGWVFSRNKTISDAEYEHALAIFADNDYDISSSVKFPSCLRKSVKKCFEIGYPSITRYCMRNADQTNK